MQMVHKPPAVMARVQTAIAFFQRNFPHYNEERLVSELVCHDFSRPVEVVRVPPMTRLIGYKDHEAAKKVGGSYFTRNGFGPQLLGISLDYQQAHHPDPQKKALVNYVTTQGIPEVLKSRCAPASDTWSILGKRVLAAGGGEQLVIPRAADRLRIG